MRITNIIHIPHIITYPRARHRCTYLFGTGGLEETDDKNGEKKPPELSRSSIIFFFFFYVHQKIHYKINLRFDCFEDKRVCARM